MKGIFKTETFFIVLVGILINLILPKIISPFATQNQIKPPNGAGKLSFYSQLIHMLVHHAQVPLSSSVIIAVIILLSLVLGKKIAKLM